MVVLTHRAQDVDATQYPNQLPRRVQDGQALEVMLGHEVRGAVERLVRTEAEDLARHDVARRPLTCARCGELPVQRRGPERRQQFDTRDQTSALNPGRDW